MTEPQVLMEGIAFGEQPRWHEGRLWFSDWGPPEVIAVDVERNHEVMLPAPAFPCCVDWLPDGRLLIVSAREGDRLGRVRRRCAQHDRRWLITRHQPDRAGP